jgi:hypothetical protein
VRVSLERLTQILIAEIERQRREENCDWIGNGWDKDSLQIDGNVNFAQVAQVVLTEIAPLEEALASRANSVSLDGHELWGTLVDCQWIAGVVAERDRLRAVSIEPKAAEIVRVERLSGLPVHVDAEDCQTVHVDTDDFDWLLHKLALTPLNDFRQSDVAKIIRREMQDNSVPATERSERAAALILANLRGHPNDEESAAEAQLTTLQDEIAALKGAIEKLKTCAAYANDIRWQELIEGADFTVIDRVMLQELRRLASQALSQDKANG